MRRIFSLLALTTFSTLAFANRTLTVSVTNPSNVERTDVPVVLSLASYGEVRSALVTLSGKEVPCQLDDLNQDDTFDELCFLADLGKKEQKEYTITLMDEGEPRTYPARTYAEMVLANMLLILIMYSTIMVSTLRASLMASAFTSMLVRPSISMASSISSWS